MADGRIVIETDLDTRQAEKDFNSFTNRLQGSADRLQGIGQSLTGALTLPLMAMGGAAIVAANDVKHAQVLIQNSLGVTDAEARKLTQTARDIYNKGFGESLEDVSKALIQTRQYIKGLNDQDLQKVTTSALNLAKTFDTDVNEVIRAGSNIMTVFGVDADHAFNLMAVGAQKGLNFSKEMFDNIAEYSPLFAQAGFSADEMFQLLIQGAKAGVYNLDYINDAIKEFGIRVQDGSKTTEEAFAQLSESTQEVWRRYQEGEATVKDVHNAVIAELSRMENKVEANQIGVDLYGTKWEDLGRDAMLSLGNIGGQLDGVSGAMDKMNKKAEESQKLTAAWRQFKDALVPLGTALLELANKALPPLVSMVQGLSNVFNALPTGVQQVIALFGVLVAAIGPVVMAVGFVGQAMAGLSSVAAALGIGVGTLLGIVGGVVAVIGILAVAYAKIDAFRNLVNQAWSMIQAGFQQLVAYLQPAVQAIVDFVVEQWQRIQDWWNENGAMITQVIQAVWSFISTIIGGALTVIWSIMQVIWKGIEILIVGVWENIKGIISGAIGVILSIIQIFAALFTGNWSKLWDGVKDLFSNALTLVWNLAQVWFVGRIFGVITKFGGKLIPYFTKTWNSISSGVTSFLSKIANWFTSRFNSITSTVSGAINRVRSIISSGLSSAISTVKSYATSFLNAGKSLLNSLADGIRRGLNAAINAVKSGMSKIRSYLPFSPAKVGPLSDLDKSGESFFPTFASKMERGLQPALSTVNAGLSQIQTRLNQDVGAIQPATNAPFAPQVIVNNPVVRSDDDIRQLAQTISEELYRIQRQNERFLTR